MSCRIIAPGLILLLAVQQSCGHEELSTRIKELGGHATVNDDGHVAIDLDGTDVTNDDLAQIGRLKQLFRLELAKTKTGDDGLKHLTRLSKLFHLNLAKSRVTDQGMQHLSQLGNLRLLNLHGTAITDAGLQHLQDLTRLEVLNLGETSVTDAGLKHLSRLQNLRFLNLSGTKITDAGLAHLKNLAGLNSFYCVEVSRTEVTERGVQEFHKIKKLVLDLVFRKAMSTTQFQPSEPVTEKEATRIKRLIFDLRTLEKPYFGLSTTLSGHDFSPLSEMEEAGAMLLTGHGIETPEAFRELVHIGPKALPFLLDALDDATPTKIEIEHGGFFGGMWFANELWGNSANHHESDVLGVGLNHPWGMEEYIDSYTVKVGDICLVVIGQITGRGYHAVRYQPTACIVINSPTHDKELLAQVRAIWSGPDVEQQLFDSLLLDYSTRGAFNGESLDGWSVGSSLQCDAAMRLLYYFPQQTANIIAKRLTELNVERTGPGRAVAATDDELDTYMERELENEVRADDFIKAVAWCKEPSIQAATLDIFRKTTDVNIQLAALPGIGEGNDALVRQRLGELLAMLPPTEGGPFGDGYNLLVTLGRYGGDEAKPFFSSYLTQRTVQRCSSMCHALRETRGEWAIELLEPLLTDTRNADGWKYAVKRGQDEPRLPIRVCDEAAETISVHDEEIAFEMVGTHAELNQQIKKIREILAARAKSKK